MKVLPYRYQGRVTVLIHDRIMCDNILTQIDNNPIWTLKHLT